MKRIAYLLPLAVAGMLLALHAQEQPAPAAPPAEAAPAEPTAPAPVESEPAPVVDTATPTPAPADPGPPNIGAYALDEMEVVKREEDLIKADALVGDGYRFLNAGEADKALERFNVARKLIGQPSPATQQSYANLVNGIAVAYTFKAEGAINAGDMAQAQNFADEALKADPENAAAKKMAERVGRDARLAASKVEKPKDMNPALTPEFLKSQNDVGILFKNGDDYFNTGQFEKALDSYKAILLKDPDNLAAARRIERVYDRKMKTANAGKEIVDKRGAWQVRDKWSEDMRRGSKDGVPEAVIADVQDRASMLDKKLDKIIIPQIKLTDSELSAAINYLGNLSRVLDAEEADPKRKGVNMVIQLNQATSEDPAAAAGEFKPNPVNLELSNVSLRDALRFVTEAANVSFRVDPVAIVIVPPGLGKQLLTKKFRTPAGFFQTEISPTTATGAGGGRSQLTGGQNIGKANVKDALEAKGVDFKTPGSNAFLIGANTLIVKNTSENLDFVEELVRVEDEYQVKIESKFVELNQNDLKELGFDWIVGSFGVAGSKVTLQGASTADGVNNLITGGNRNTNGTGGRQAITASSIDALLNGAAAAAFPPNALLALTGVLTKPEFQVVIRAINEKKNVDLLSAPTVTTKSGNLAKIEISREFIYPTEYERPQLPTTSTTTVGGASAAIVAPANPSGFQTRSTGVILTVTPQVGANKRTIDLTIVPEVVEFDGFINYGSPIFDASGNLLTQNAINQPIFSVRRVTTNVYIFDGETVVIGGLIREDIQKVNDKVPLLGDIPGLGRLFQSKVEQSLKKNLMIFVSASLVDPAGSPLNK